MSGSRVSKTKLAKIVVECRKEGTVNYLTPESLEQPTGTHKWEKCKLVLVKTVGGYMLEFYSPPKSQKVRFIISFSSVFLLPNYLSTLSKSLRA